MYYLGISFGKIIYSCGNWRPTLYTETSGQFITLEKEMGISGSTNILPTQIPLYSNEAYSDRNVTVKENTVTMGICL